MKTCPESAALQLLLATKKLEGLQELEQQAWEEYAKRPTPQSLRTAAFSSSRCESASAEVVLAGLQLEAVKPYRDLHHYDRFRDLQSEEPTE